MKNLPAYRKPRKVTNFLSILISLTFVIAWLPFIRSIFDGDSYQWGMRYFGLQLGGMGINEDFVFIVIQLFLYIFLIVSMYRVRNRKIYYLLLIWWWIHVFGNFISEIMMHGGSMLHGDTLNIHISTTWIILPLSLLTLVLVWLEIKSDLLQHQLLIPWSEKNSLLLGLFMVSIPIQGLLLADGEPHGLTDIIGVLMGIIQAFLMLFIFKPYFSTLKHDASHPIN